MMTVGGCLAFTRALWPPPRTSTICSLTMSMICCIGREALRDLRAERVLPHAGDELLYDLVVDVRFEQGEAHLAQGLVEVLLGDGAAAAEASEDALQLVGEGVKHIYKMRA